MKAVATFVPTLKDAAEAGSLAGGVALGIIASHAAGKMVDKINSPIGHGVMLVGGFYGACVVKHSLLRALCAGAAVYGGLRLAAKGVEVAAAATSGVGALIPDSVKTALAKYIPTFAGIEEVAGLGETDDSFSGEDAPSLENVGASGMGNDDNSLIAGFGEVLLAA